VVALVVIGGGAYLFRSGGGDPIADDGPHRLTAPATVIDGTYQKSGKSSSSGAMSTSDLKNAESWGVKNPKDVHGDYEAENKTAPLAGKALTFEGVYGQIDDPGKTVDAMFGFLKDKAAEDPDNASVGELVGSPKAYEPAGLDNAVLKCQQLKIKNDGPSSGDSAAPREAILPVCIWGDHSTLSFTVPVDMATLLTGKSTPLEDAAATTAKLRDDVRVTL
jgi:hypothetical protein